MHVTSENARSVWQETERWTRTTQTSPRHPFHQCGINWIWRHAVPSSDLYTERRCESGLQLLVYL